jgi:dolichol kinase
MGAAGAIAAAYDDSPVETYVNAFGNYLWNANWVWYGWNWGSWGSGASSLIGQYYDDSPVQTYVDAFGLWLWNANWLWYGWNWGSWGSGASGLIGQYYDDSPVQYYVDAFGNWLWNANWVWYGWNWGSWGSGASSLIGQYYDDSPVQYYVDAFGNWLWNANWVWYGWNWGSWGSGASSLIGEYYDDSPVQYYVDAFGNYLWNANWVWYGWNWGSWGSGASSLIGEYYDDSPVQSYVDSFGSYLWGANWVWYGWNWGSWGSGVTQKIMDYFGWEADYETNISDLAWGIWDGIMWYVDNWSWAGIMTSIVSGIMNGVTSEDSQSWIDWAGNNIYVKMYNSIYDQIWGGSPARRFFPIGLSVAQGVSKGTVNAAPAQANIAANAIADEFDDAMSGALGDRVGVGIELQTDAMARQLKMQQDAVANDWSRVDALKAQVGLMRDQGGLNQWGDPADTVYAGGSPHFNESTGRYQDYKGIPWMPVHETEPIRSTSRQDKVEHVHRVRLEGDTSQANHLTNDDISNIVMETVRKEKTRRGR